MCDLSTPAPSPRRAPPRPKATPTTTDPSITPDPCHRRRPSSGALYPQAKLTTAVQPITLHQRRRASPPPHRRNMQRCRSTLHQPPTPPSPPLPSRKPKYALTTAAQPSIHDIITAGHPITTHSGPVRPSPHHRPHTRHTALHTKPPSPTRLRHIQPPSPPPPSPRSQRTPQSSVETHSTATLFIAKQSSSTASPVTPPPGPSPPPPRPPATAASPPRRFLCSSFHLISPAITRNSG